MSQFTQVTNTFGEITDHINSIGGLLLEAKLNLSKNQYDYLSTRVETELGVSAQTAIARFKEQNN